jgi:hypothetical protein
VLFSYCQVVNLKLCQCASVVREISFGVMVWDDLDFRNRKVARYSDVVNERFFQWQGSANLEPFHAA